MDDDEARSSSENSKSEAKPLETPTPPEADAPLREEQVQNAVSFLSHPKVKRKLPVLILVLKFCKGADDPRS